MYKIVCGLATDKKNFNCYDAESDIEHLSKTNKNTYLVYDGDEEHKIYFDIDLKKEEYEKHGTYEEIKDNILNTLKQSLEGYSKLSIAEACKKDVKISYRFILNDYKLKIKDMKDWIKQIKNEFDGYIKDAIDTAPYMSSGKIRLPYSTKEGEDRPLNIIQGNFKDFLTNKVNQCDLIDIEPIKEKQINKVIDKVNKIVSKEKMNNVKVDDDIMIDLLNSLDVSRSNNYLDWVVVGMALFNDGYDQKLFKTFSKRSKKYIIGCDITKWNQFKNIKSVITTASLWYYLSKDNNEKFNELRDKVDLKNYDFKIDLKENNFDEKTMFKLMNDDIKEMGLIQYAKRFFNKTKSFQYFNHYHFKMIDNNMLFRIQFIGKRKEINNVDIKSYMSFIYEQGLRTFNFIDAWQCSIDKQSYTTIDFSPKEKLRNDIFNLFNGFVYEDENKDYNLSDIQPILDHIKYICNEEEKVYNYVLDWVSHIIQKPNRKTETSLVIYSHKHGVGKNVFTEILQEIFNGYVLSDVKLDNLVGKFNSSLKAKLLIIADEVSPSAKELNDTLKNMITRKEINIEYKGKESIKMKDTANYIFTTNNELAFKVSEEDRRYCLIECPTVKKDADYFDILYKLIDDDSIIKQLFNFFLTRDITNINIRNIPLTKYKKRNIFHNMPYYIKMIIDCPVGFAERSFTFNEIKSEFIRYCFEKNLFKPNVTDTRIGIDLNEKFGKFKTRVKTNVVYTFPSLIELEKYIKIELNIDDDEI